MTVSHHTSPQIIDIGALSWCWAQLGSAGEGTLSFDAPRHRVSRAVSYAVTDERISISPAAPEAINWRVGGAGAQLEVSGRTCDDLRWIVRATGQVDPGDPAEPAGLAHCRRVHPANGARSYFSNRLFLRTPRVRGFYETPLPH